MSNKFKDKKLLVLGGAFQHCKVVEAAHDLGVVVYVVDYLENSPAKEIADFSFLIDIKDVDSIVELCKEEKIDGVISTSLDPCQIPYQQVASRLNFPCFGTHSQFEALTNKTIFKEICKKYGVDIIPTYSVSEINNINETEYPVFVKPVDSRGSRGQSVANDYCELIDAIEFAKKESSNGEVIIEKFMDGYQDFTVAYMVVEGNPILVRTGDRYVGSKKEGLNKVAIASASPSKYTNMYVENIHPHVVDMIRGLGILNGPVFMQGFIDGDTVRFYDPGLRFSGGEYERILKKATNVDLIKELVKFSLSNKIEKNNITDNLYDLNGKKLMQLCPTVISGTIGNVLGKKEIIKRQEVISFFSRYNIGDKVPNHNNVSRRFAEICTLCDSHEKEQEVLSFIQKALVVENEFGNDMICDKLKLDLL